MKIYNKLKKYIILSLVGGLLIFGNVWGADTSTGYGFTKQITTYNPDLPSSDSLQGAKLISAIQSFINWVLGLLALIAVGVILWGGFQMVTAAGDENKYKKGFDILKQAGIGLVLIGLAWLIVSLFFYIVGVMTGVGATSGSRPTVNKPKSGS